jgi:lipoprotein-releasing system ATP-binding protein
MPLIEATGIHKSYHDGTRELQVLRGADLTLDKGESLAIIGASGSGKSTLLHVLGGLDAPDDGEILLSDEPMAKASRKRMAIKRRDFSGFVFQAHHLMGEFNAQENVMIPMMAARASKREAAGRAVELLDSMGLKERATHRPSQLSGGEQQRVAIARALANDPQVILADEPTGNLDSETGGRVADILFNLASERGLVLVTHDHELAGRADRIMRLEDGVLSPV